jgi:hypothetical protein
MEASFSDTESGLEWIIHTHQKMTGSWDEVMSFISDNGDNSWRMPNIIDALSVISMGNVVGLKHVEFANIEFWLNHREATNENNYYMISFKEGDSDIRRSNKQNRRNIVLVREIE